MEILKSLGINDTLWIHMACFIVSFIAVSKLILIPYSRAYREREKRTVGSEELAARLTEETNELHAEYERHARAISGEIKAAYDKSRMAAMKEYEQIVDRTRTEVAAMIEKSREQITREVQAAQKTLSAEIPAVGSAIASKLAGKEISL